MKEMSKKMNYGDYLKLVSGIFFIIVAVVIPMYLVWLLLGSTSIIEMILLGAVVVAWVLFVPWNLPIEDWIGDFVKRYRSD